MTGVDKLDDELRTRLGGLADDELVDVLVYPVSAPSDLERHLSALQAEGVRHNLLKLHGTFAVHAPKRLIHDLARRDDVARITAMPSATIDTIGSR